MAKSEEIKFKKIILEFGLSNELLKQSTGIGEICGEKFLFGVFTYLNMSV